jgi:hypothetical protein
VHGEAASNRQSGFSQLTVSAHVRQARITITALGDKLVESRCPVMVVAGRESAMRRGSVQAVINH